MRSFALIAPFVATAYAARPFLNEADTGIEDVLGATPVGTLPPLSSMIALNDFDWAARKYMKTADYTYYRAGAAGEFSYRNNLEVYSRYRLRPKTFVDILNIESTLPTTILGYNFSAPFFISPCARGGLANPAAERGLIEAAAQANILYMPALYATLTIEQIASFKPTNSTPQITFQQVYLDQNITATQVLFRRAEAAGSKAIIYTVDSAADGNRHRAARYGVGSADTSYSLITWNEFSRLQNLTSLPLIPKGIMTVEDAQAAVKAGAKAIILSNHGGRQLDGAPSSFEVALEIHETDPDLFNQIEVYADGGVRYGTDVLKLLALGVKAVGIGRPMMYANIYGTEGVKKAIDIMKHEISIDAGNMGVADLKKIDSSFIKTTPNNWMG